MCSRLITRCGDFVVTKQIIMEHIIVSVFMVVFGSLVPSIILVAPRGSTQIRSAISACENAVLLHTG